MKIKQKQTTKTKGPIHLVALVSFCAIPRLSIRLRALLAVALLFGYCGSSAAQDKNAVASTNSPSSGIERSYGIPKRIPWTTSRITGSPDAPPPYQVKRVFPKLKFQDPVDLCQIPGTDRFILTELGGKIHSFRKDVDPNSPDLVLDVRKEIKGAEQVYGLAFHPDFEKNRFVYICYVLKSDLPDGSRVSRFKVTLMDPPQIDPASETILITWLSGGHNGGSLQFGPDGFLYISTGDGAGPNPPDPRKTGQDNSDLLSAILRIDVDRTEQGRPYRVPEDNPFLNTDGMRPEIWSYGFRNPWRMSFDKKTGALWTGDVGWELWELVYRVERGGNYGWSVVEGPQTIHPDWKRGPTPILPPIKAHPHSEAASITGGYVYYGKRLKDLVGAYVYGDWVTGKIWALRNEGSKLTSLQELVDTPLQIICFGEDSAGELYVVDYAGGIYQLEPNTGPPDFLNFPRKLSETGLFDSTKHHKPAPGVIPFLVNADMWADHALAERFVALPGNSAIQTGATNVWLYQSKNEWRYPTNAVLAKTFFLYLARGNPMNLRRVETQVLHYDGLDWHAYTYRWNDEQTDASLVAAEGDEQIFNIEDPNIRGGHRQQSWRFHSRTECLRCHNPWVNYALAFTAPQLNRPVQYQAGHPVCGSLPIESKPAPWINEATTTDNQLRTFSHLGYFDQPLDERARPKLSNPYDTSAASTEAPSTAQPAGTNPPPPGTEEEKRIAESERIRMAGFTNLNERARSWLHVNCAHCHRDGAGGSVVSRFDYDTKLADLRAIGRKPSQGDFGLIGAHVITPGDPYSSALFYRVSATGQGRMPLIGSRFVDVPGTKLIHDWIQQLPKELSEDKTNDDAAEKLRAENAEAIKWVWPAFNNTSISVDRLLASANGALAFLSTTYQRGRFSDPRLIEKISHHPSFAIRGLFEPFLPESERPQRLGVNIKPAEILALKGEAWNGKRIFFREGGLQCSQCHRLEGVGRELGPDLSKIGSKYDRAQLLDNILNPSKIIDPAFTTFAVETKDDFSYTGFLVKKTAEEIVLKDAETKEIHVPAGQVKLLQPQKLSAMPELLLQNSTAQEAADLLEYLSSLR
jgi:putative heme-binding domain-containing protein